MRKVLILLVAAVFVMGFAVTASADDDYYQFATKSFSGYGAESYGDYVFAVGRDNKIHGWKVTIPTGADPNDRDYGGSGTFAPRTFTDLGTINLGYNDLGHSAELYVGNGIMWYGSGNDVYLGGTTGLRAYTWSVTGNTLSGARAAHQDVIFNNTVSSSETLAYDENTGTWYCGTRGRGIYHLDGSNNWVYDFTHMNMAGSHQDGIEMMGGELYVSDMTSDHIARYQNLGTVSNPDWQIFDKDLDGIREETFDDTYNYSSSYVVEGMGVGALTHFWVTSGSTLYELGGGTLPPPPIPEPATMLLLGSGLFSLIGLRKKKFFSNKS
ncbi:MAG: PEP-CTERM sorting domain-containing protein [Deltaproteobacteria bacterium]|nr:PEP-CTERM sorting domain-containing protein [Deltaproteobacteria bacterium]